MTIASDFSGGLSQIVQALGSNLTITKPDGSSRSARGAITTIGTENAQLINAIGIEGRVIYFLNLTPTIEKFDSITAPNGREYAVRDVHEIMVDDSVVGLRCVVAS